MRKTLMGGGLVAASAAVASAVALAASGPGVPETNEFGADWLATAVSASERTCTGTDGEYLERLVHYQAPSSMTFSSDPRFGGLIDFHLHELYRTSGGVPVGHIDGTIHWYASDTGPKTAFARVSGIWREGLIDGGIGGAGGSDGYAFASGALPRAVIYGAITLNEAVDGTLAGMVGRNKEALETIGTPFSGGVLASFNCPGRYQPTDVGSMPTREMSAAQRAAAVRRMSRLAGRSAPPRQARRSRARLRVPVPAEPLAPDTVPDLLSGD